MQSKNVKTIIRYYYGIPEMQNLLRREREDLEDEYNGLRGMEMDGVPHGTSSGKPVEALAEHLDGNNVRNRLEENSIKAQVLSTDSEVIRDCLDALNGRYKRVVSMRYRDGYSWARLAVRMEAPDSTVRRWHDRAIQRVGEALEDMPMVDELLGRASRARV